MKLQNTRQLPVGQAIAWAALNDTALLQRAIPGCESLTKIGENLFEVALVAAVGPVRAKFKGRLELSDLVEPTSYRLEFEGSGGAAGYGKGRAEVRLEPLDDFNTLLHYTAQASVGGKLSQVGSRLVDMASNKMATDFFDRFEACLPVQRQSASAAPLDTSTGSWWQRLVFKFGRIFVRKGNKAANLP